MIVNKGVSGGNGSVHEDCNGDDLMMMNVKKMMMLMIFSFLLQWLSWVVQFCFSSGFTTITAITQPLFCVR